MTEFYDKYSVHQTLVEPIKLFQYPKDKMEALNCLRMYGDTSDIKYVYPLVFSENTELAISAAEVVSDIMKKIIEKHWNNIYNEVKYIEIDKKKISGLLNFNEEISTHLLGIASLNSNGYIREKALRLISGMKSSSVIPYILLRLNDWVLPVRIIAEHVLRNTLTEDNIEMFIDNSYLINKLQNALRSNLKDIWKEIVYYLKNDSLINKVKSKLKHSNVKTRLFCYMLLEDSIADDDIINYALRDKSFEIRVWLVKAIKTINCDKRNIIIEKLLCDKSAKVKVAVLRNYEDIICINFRERLEKLLIDEHKSIRDEARFITKKHLFIKDFAEYYREQIFLNPVYGALVGLGETGNKDDFDVIRGFGSHDEPKIRLAAMIGMWHLSKKDTVKYVIGSLECEVPKIKKTAKKLLKSSKMPEVFFEMRRKLQDDNSDIKLFALDIISEYGGWLALEAILFAVSKEHGLVLDKAKVLLYNWLAGSYSIYTRLDNSDKSKIIGYIKTVQDRSVISSETIKELNFIIEARK